MAISQRGASLAKVGFDHGELDEYHSDTNPNGICRFLYAENRLMHNDLITFINANSTFHPSSSIAYSEGYTGSHRLRSATAVHLNEYFRPTTPLSAEHITYAAGVTALNEAVALCLCDPDQTPSDAILLGKWNYGAFPTDFVARTGVELVYAEFGSKEQFGEGCVEAYERAVVDAEREGKRVRVLVVCNPHNPLGRCYTPEALQGLMRLCEERDIHLVSDEIYALSVYQREGRECEKFTSVLAMQKDEMISPERLHVLYGLSKDYGAGGLRLGCLVSRNESFIKAVRGGVCRFSSPSILSMDVATKMLEDRDFIRSFLEKSKMVLARQRALIEKLLDEAGIKHSTEGNAGLFVWLDLSPSLRPEQLDGDLWAAERALAQRLVEGGVVLSTGERYQSEKPGFFRMIFSYDEASLREGVRRIAQVCRDQKV